MATPVKMTPEQFNKLVALIYSEVGNLDLPAMRMVGGTVINRANANKKYFGGADIGSVIEMPGQYHGTKTDRYKNALMGKFNNDIEQKAFEQAVAAARSLEAGDVPKGHFFFTPDEIKRNPKLLNWSLTQEVGRVGPYQVLELK